LNRWFEQIPNEFIGVLDSYIIHLQHKNENLYYTFYTNISNKNLLKTLNDRQTETSLILHDYFQLSIKLDELFQQWCKSDERFQNNKIPTGIRVLAQDPLENLISFICSSNNNVQRITKMIRSLCDEYGKEIGTLNEITYHQFPTIDELDKSNIEQRLRELNFGYRARYIQQAIQYLKYTINDLTFLDQLKSLSVKEARIQLLKIMGVGRKVRKFN
jgi:N-glycosylase/DNA lyase